MFFSYRKSYRDTRRKDWQIAKQNFQRVFLYWFAPFFSRNPLRDLLPAAAAVPYSIIDHVISWIRSARNFSICIGTASFGLPDESRLNFIVHAIQCTRPGLLLQVVSRHHKRQCQSNIKRNGALSMEIRNFEG